ncbi:Zinc finger RING/FYVE/PHD-type protein [Dioscorea alata]|uniref:Zinc finger RING/FYVE/PHD-type protein n=1 Tax=Dioscorea alata TaxID=55571 RepID=A0ACB7WAR4_DIOAL|nr:Zinc finger RING/FYVE/PHD-type protein [Dioscorea alata]
MVGDFMVCVDRIIASACFDPHNGLAVAAAPAAHVKNGPVGLEEGSSENKKGGSVKKKKKGGGEVIECRICQEEGEEGDMESPCACNGTLKFAHRKCIQRWCNKKGDITCEICNQVYTPNYSIPPSRATSDVMAIDIRQNWAAGIDLNNPHYLAIAAAEQEFLRAEYENYAAASSSGIYCCRTVALILMLLLLVRHILMVIVDSGMVQDISPFFNVSLLQFLGFLLPCYVIVRACYIVQSRRRRQV